MDIEKERRLNELLKKEITYKAENKLEFYDPYSWQKDFHNDPSKRKALEAGNQIGKCVTYQTLIDTTEGKKRIGDIFGEEIEVLTYPNKEPRKVLNWVRKPAEECFRITMSDGQWIECPRKHLILTNKGYVYAQQLDAFPYQTQKARHKVLVAHTWPHSLQASTSVLFRLIHALNGRRYIQRLRDCLDDCLVDRRLRGERPLYDQDNVQVFAPLPSGVQQQTSFLCNLGGQLGKDIGSLCGKLHRLSSQYAGRLISGLYGSFVCQSFSSDAQYMIQSNETPWLSNDFVNRLPQVVVTSIHQFESSLSSVIPVLTKGNRIVSVRSVGVKTLYDMEVDERHNYYAGGLINHNTVAGCVQDAFDLTGLYPDWYTGLRYDKPVLIVCGGINNEKTCGLLQKALLGDPVIKEQSLGLGWIPKKCLDRDKISLKRGVTDAFLHVKVRHYTNGKQDGWSTLTFQSYESGKSSWMGDTIDIFHLDEEPPMDILGQAGRGCIASRGSIRCTYTPENGQTDVVIKIKGEWSLHKAGWPDVAGEDFDYKADGETIKFRTVYTMNGNPGHVTQETVKEAEKDFPAYQMKMRMQGIPVLGSGQVYTYSEEQIKITPLDEIPSSWPRGAAMDFGGTSDESHPSAVVWGAYDEINDVIYIHDGFRTYGDEIQDVAAKIISKPHPDWIPMFWPHDGAKGKKKNDPAGGTVADKYRDYGINMFDTHFTNPDDEKGEGKGGIRIEPGIVEISGRISDRRIRVFKTVDEWFEEYRNYHQKDGKIVDKDDDLMAATRYLVQMLRHFVKEEDAMEWEEEYFEENSTGRSSVTGY